eukprot:gene25284-biopygen22480
MPDTIQEWHAEETGPIDGTHGCAQKMVFLVCTGAAVRPSARPKDAFFRTVGARIPSGKGPIDGTHGCAQKIVFSFPSGEPVRPSARPKDAFFERLVSESRQGFSSLSLHAMIRGSFLEHFVAFWGQNTAENDVSHALHGQLERRSLTKDPMDGIQGLTRPGPARPRPGGPVDHQKCRKSCRIPSRNGEEVML